MASSFPPMLLYGADYNPEQWSESVWLEDMRLMKLAGVNMVSINIFSWASLEPRPEEYHFERLDRIMDLLAEHGIQADLATATASPPTWMSRVYPQMLPVTAQGVRLTHGSRQHYCPNSPDYRRKAALLVERLAERYQAHPALRMWHVNNELGCHISQCYCDTCAEAFRSWLQERYQSLEALNATWGTAFWSQQYFAWEDILPPRATPTFHNPGQMLDYWRFMSDSLLGCLRQEADILRRVTPAVPVTTNLMVAHKPVNGFAWAADLDLISVDQYPHIDTPAWEWAMTHDLMRSLKAGRPHLVMEQSPSQVNWQPQNPHKRPEVLYRQSLQSVARGADGVLYFQWRQSQAGAELFHGAIVTHEGSEHTRTFQQAARIGADLQRLSPHVVGTRMGTPVALLMDWQNWWAVENQPAPSDQLSYWDELKAAYRALYALNAGVDIVTPESDLSPYRLVVAPLLFSLKSSAARNLEGFVAQGGIFLTTFFSGIVDERYHASLGGYPGPLRKLLGIHVEEFDPLTPEMRNTLVIPEGSLQGTYETSLWGESLHGEQARTVGTFASDYYAGRPALTVNSYGQGQAWYLAAHTGPDLWTKLIRHLAGQASIQPLLKASEGVEITCRRHADGRAVYFLLNHTAQQAQVSLPAGQFRSLLDEREIYDAVQLEPFQCLVLLQESSPGAAI